jgi:hypothetical protein
VRAEREGEAPAEPRAILRVGSTDAAQQELRPPDNCNTLENDDMKTIYATTAIMSFFANTALAGEFGCPCCQSCGGACALKVEQIEEDEICYDVECEEVCIPAVRFPWESCRTPKCGRVRVVAKLREDKTKKTRCKYEWVLTCTRCGRAASAPNDENKTSPKKKPADGTPPMPPMPKMAPAASAASQHQVPIQRAAKSQAGGAANYIGRSSTR